MTHGSHCTYCGAQHANADWPKTCPGCGKTTWRNPTPVAVALLPVETDEGLALLMIRREVEPRKGFLALPGGYVDHGESWQAGCAREIQEETQVEVDPATVTLFDVLSPPDGGTVLIFGELPPVPASSLPAFTGSSETSERALLRGPEELAFPLHTQVANAWFARR